jgi:hypothetical protein
MSDRRVRHGPRASSFPSIHLRSRHMGKPFEVEAPYMHFHCHLTTRSKAANRFPLIFEPVRSLGMLRSCRDGGRRDTVVRSRVNNLSVPYDKNLRRLMAYAGALFDRVRNVAAFLDGDNIYGKLNFRHHLMNISTGAARIAVLKKDYRLGVRRLKKPIQLIDRTD